MHKITVTEKWLNQSKWVFKSVNKVKRVYCSLSYVNWFTRCLSDLIDVIDCVMYLVSASAINCMKRPVFKMTFCVSTVKRDVNLYSPTLSADVIWTNSATFVFLCSHLTVIAENCFKLTPRWTSNFLLIRLVMLITGLVQQLGAVLSNIPPEEFLSFRILYHYVYVILILVLLFLQLKKTRNQWVFIVTCWLLLLIITTVLQ